MVLAVPNFLRPALRGNLALAKGIGFGICREDCLCHDEDLSTLAQRIDSW